MFPTAFKVITDVRSEELCGISLGVATWRSKPDLKRSWSTIGSSTAGGFPEIKFRDPMKGTELGWRVLPVWLVRCQDKDELLKAVSIKVAACRSWRTVTSALANLVRSSGKIDPLSASESLAICVLLIQFSILKRVESHVTSRGKYRDAEEIRT